MGACASRFNVLKDGADPPPPAPIIPSEVDEASNRLSFDHLLQERNEGKKGSSEIGSKASELVKNQDLVEGNCQENGSLKSLQPVDDSVLKTEVEKTPITEGLMCKTSEELRTDNAKAGNQSEESEAIPRSMERKQVEIIGKDVNPLKTENLSAQEGI